jgi:hypothetical protein
MITISILTIICSFLNLIVLPVLFPLPEVAPLQGEVIEDLCNQLELPKTDPLCDGSGEVRERDFFPRISDAIENGKLQNQADWEERFGTYLVECTEVAENADGIKPIRCDYNFNFDSTYSISVKFIYGQLDRVFYLAPDSP